MREADSDAIDKLQYWGVSYGSALGTTYVFNPANLGLAYLVHAGSHRFSL